MFPPRPSLPGAMTIKKKAGPVADSPIFFGGDVAGGADAVFAEAAEG